MENLDLIRELAWTFKEKTNLDYTELFSRASEAYCEAQERFDPKQGVKFTTFAYTHIKNMLINYCKKETREQSRYIPHGEFPVSIHPTQSIESDFWEEVENWPQECLQVAKMILKSPEKFLGETPNFSRPDGTPLQRVKKTLRSKGWTHHMVSNTIRQMKTLIQTL